MSQLPASKISNLKKQSNTGSFSVVSQLGTLLQIDYYGLEVLYPGDVLTFEDQNAVVTKVSGSNIEARLSSTKLVHPIGRFRYGNHTYPSHLILDSNFKIGVLDVLCQTNSSHERGLLGWTMYYGDKSILIGSDYYEANRCFVEGNQLWIPGSYTIVITSFTKQLGAIKQADFSWNLETPQRILSCGGYSSSLSPINMV